MVLPTLNPQGQVTCNEVTVNNLSVFEFESQQIRFVNGKPVANDVAAVLGYKDPADAVYRKVESDYKGVVRASTPGGKQMITVLETEGVLQLVSSSRLPNAIDIAQRMGLYVLNCKHEQESLRIIQAAFEDLCPIPQFQVCGYRIDLYLSMANIAIECDETGHLSAQYSCDSERENLIKSKLGCSFVRYNPSQAGFNVGKVILRIRELIG